MSPRRPPRQPVEWVKLDYYDPTDRFLDCFHYDKCLGVAIHERWKGWTCRYCGINQYKLKREEEQANGDQSEVPTN